MCHKHTHKQTQTYANTNKHKHTHTCTFTDTDGIYVYIKYITYNYIFITSVFYLCHGLCRNPIYKQYATRLLSCVHNISFCKAVDRERLCGPVIWLMIDSMSLILACLDLLLRNITLVIVVYYFMSLCCQLFQICLRCFVDIVLMFYCWNRRRCSGISRFLEGLDHCSLAIDGIRCPEAVGESAVCRDTEGGKTGT